jgi:hypothetical protein
MNHTKNCEKKVTLVSITLPNTRRGTRKIRLSFIANTLHLALNRLYDKNNPIDGLYSPLCFAISQKLIARNHKLRPRATDADMASKSNHCH